MRILCSTIPQPCLQKQLIEKFPNHTFDFQNDLTDNDEKLARADILITFGENFTIAHLENAKELKWICLLSAGLEKMPLKEIAEKNILVTNARGVHAVPMAEYALSMMLSHVKCLNQMFVNQQKQLWQPKQPFQELQGKKLLLLGTGSIAQEVARLAKAFSMEVVGINKSSKPQENFDQIHSIAEILSVLPKADFVISILPSTKETDYILKSDHFKAMKQEAVFMNLGRGSLFEREVLIEAIEKAEIAHAILDVFDEEPLPTSHPYWHLPNVTITPHISSHSKNYLPKAFGIFERNLVKLIEGKEEEFENKIDFNRGY